MRNRRLLIVVALIAFLAGIGWVHAQQRGRPGIVTTEDYAEIQQLCARYVQGTDFDNQEMWLSVFAADGVLALGPGRAGTRTWS